MKYTCISATSNIDGANYKFSDEALAQLASQVNPTIKVTHNFDHGAVLGQALSGTASEGKLYLTLELDELAIEKVELPKYPLYCVPGLRIKEKPEDRGDYLEFSNVVLVSMGLVANPVDPNVTPIEPEDHLDTLSYLLGDPECFCQKHGRFIPAGILKDCPECQAERYFEWKPEGKEE